MIKTTIKDCFSCRYRQRATKNEPCIRCTFSKSDSDSGHLSCNGCSAEISPNKYEPCVSCEGSMWEEAIKRPNPQTKIPQEAL